MFSVTVFSVDCRLIIQSVSSPILMVDQVSVSILHRSNILDVTLKQTGGKSTETQLA